MLYFALSAPVAQLDRVPGYEPGGRGFKSCRARQTTQGTSEKGLRAPFSFVRISSEGVELMTKKVKESSGAFFQNLRPKFLDWRPATEEEKALEVKARQDARDAELKRVTDLAKKRDAGKGAATRRRAPGFSRSSRHAKAEAG